MSLFHGERRDWGLALADSDNALIRVHADQHEVISEPHRCRMRQRSGYVVSI